MRSWQRLEGSSQRWAAWARFMLLCFGSMFQLRPFQKEALTALETPSHVICVAPTGSGKSLIYEKMASRPNVRLLLVTPLVALARQQRSQLEKQGLQVSLGAGNPLSQDPSAIPGPATGVWIVSPELLQNRGRQRVLDKWKPNFLVVDECHCLWEWGKDFRPAFSPLPELLRRYKIPRSLWLTATLPQNARVELKASLPPSVIEIGNFQLPPNQILNVLKVPLNLRLEILRHWVDSQNAPGLIFVSTREDTKRVSLFLSSLKKRVVAYHAGMSREERRNREDQISNQACDVIVATSAFGLGIHYPHLKWVVLWQPPLTLLGLAQSIGRVGRISGKDRSDNGSNDLNDSMAIVFWDEEDFKLLEWAVRDCTRMRNEFSETRQFLQQRKCRRIILTEYFERVKLSEHKDQACGNYCDFCRSGVSGMSRESSQNFN